MKITYNNEQTSLISFNPKDIIDLLPDDYLLIIDQKIFYLYQDYLKPILNNSNGYLLIKAKETNKNQISVNQIYDFLFENNATRYTNLISIGGGLIGDLVGYCAATYLRGLPFIQIPTTLLSQVDSSIGAKVGINRFNHKNMIGTFYPASLIIIDSFFLTKLSTRQFKSGLVELIKHGLIADENLFKEIEKYDNIQQIKNDSNLIELIKQSLLIKKKYVIEDPYDLGIRHTLNYAHTLAHALELESDLYHGECLAIAVLVNLYGSTDYLRVKNLFQILELIREFPPLNINKIINDKKRIKDNIKEVFLNKIGESYLKEVKITSLIKQYQSNYQKLSQEYQVFSPYFILNPQKLQGSVSIPPSKSALHRYLIASALSNEKTILYPITSLNDDIKTTIEVLKHLNTRVEYLDNKLIITPYQYDDLSKIINFNESASTLRMLLLFLVNKQLVGHPSLTKRPIDTYLDIFNKQKITYNTNDKIIEFNKSLKSGIFEINENISSQFISGLLFYLPTLNNDSQIILKDKPISLPYIKMTMQTLKDFNVEIKTQDYQHYYIKGNQKYCSKPSYQIEQDYSARSFFEVARQFNDINITNPITPSLQGDYQLIKIINDKEKVLNLENSIDAAPIMSIYYSKIGGTLNNTQRLVFKESNRLQAIENILTKAKIPFSSKDNTLIIKAAQFNGNTFNTFHDHRITMSLIIACTISNSPIIINEVTSINKSFPTFIEEFEKLGGFIDEQ